MFVRNEKDLLTFVLQSNFCVSLLKAVMLCWECDLGGRIWMS